MNNCKIFLIAIIILFTANVSYSQIFFGCGDGLNTTVTGITYSPDGRITFICGYFTGSGGTTINYAAKYNYENNTMSYFQWEVDKPANAIAATGTGENLYMGGEFTSAGSGSLLKYFPAENSSLNDSNVYSPNNVITSIEAVTLNHVGKWDGSNWSALGSGLSGGEFPNVYAIAISGSNVYAGGIFTTAGSTLADNIAMWNGSDWSALGTGVDQTVYAITASGTDIYVGGNFSTADGTTVNHIAKWNGSNWSALGDGVSGTENVTINTIAVSGTDIYVGGHFSFAGGTGANNIAKWNGSGWSSLGSGMNDDVLSIVISGSDLYAGGMFTTAGGSSANGLAKWSEGSWSAIGDGVAGGEATVYTLCINPDEGKMYVGGNFTTADGVSANNIAKFSDSNNPLPVELLSFTATTEQENIVLNWQTATEVNNYGFEIERKIECLNDCITEWEKIGFIEGHGNSNSPQSYSFIDNLNLILNLNPNLTRIYYRLKQIDFDGTYKYYDTIAEVDVPVTNVENELPAEFSLPQNYPNPFNPVTKIKFTIPAVETAHELSLQQQFVTLIVYNLLGQEVATLVDEPKLPGVYEVYFDASNLTSGIYYYRITAGKFSSVRKMIFLK